MANPLTNDFDSVTKESVIREMTAKEYSDYLLTRTPQPEPTPAQKLESAGLSVAELKTLLGLPL